MFESAALVAFVPVSDLARARSFYEGTLGLTVQDADEFGALLNSHGTPVRLAVVDEHTPATFTTLGWVVPSIEEAVRALDGRGVVLHHYDGMGQDADGIWTAPSGSRVAWFSDSEGNTLSVTQLY
ncbi:MAG TPA: VOC family protein [Acidimicrobiales bacterium]|nr:VOC family protein [Acidimicrobiales bacterium]